MDVTLPVELWFCIAEMLETQQDWLAFRSSCKFFKQVAEYLEQRNLQINTPYGYIASKYVKKLQPKTFSPHRTWLLASNYNTNRLRTNRLKKLDQMVAKWQDQIFSLKRNIKSVRSEIATFHNLPPIVPPKKRSRRTIIAKTPNYPKRSEEQLQLIQLNVTSLIQRWLQTNNTAGH